MVTSTEFDGESCYIILFTYWIVFFLTIGSLKMSSIVGRFLGSTFIMESINIKEVVLAGEKMDIVVQMRFLSSFEYFVLILLYFPLRIFTARAWKLDASNACLKVQTS